MASNKLTQIFEHTEEIMKILGISIETNIRPFNFIAGVIGHGCKSTHIQVLILLTILIMLLLDCGGFMISTLFGFVYPAYKSYKCLEKTHGVDEHKQWITYWVIYSFLTVCNSLVALILHYLPFYHLFKIVFLLYLFHDKSKGALAIYD